MILGLLFKEMRGETMTHSQMFIDRREVMQKTDWSYPVDIWNVGVMVYLSSPLSISIPCTDQLGKTGVGFA